MLDAFTAVRAANLLLASATPEHAWSRVGVQEERGPLTFRLLLQEIAGHDVARVRQFGQALAAVSAR